MSALMVMLGCMTIWMDDGVSLAVSRLVISQDVSISVTAFFSFLA